MVPAKIMTAREVAAEIERTSFSAVLMFSAIGLLISLSIIILDQHIPGEWF